MKLTRRELLHTFGAAGVGLVASKLLPACAGDDPDAPYGGPFQHGVASGDPLPDAVILWTRVTPPAGSAPMSVDVAWEIATDPALADVVSSGTATTDPARDYTVKIDVGSLAPGTTHFYRFHSLGADSPVGRTRTAPTGAVDHLRFGFVSCSALSQGYFHAYRSLAARLDLDAVLHVGDYIYEFATGEYGDVRAFEPSHELITLDDYRTRYAQYRRDPDLQAAHRQHPFITTWDDHEIANDSWRDGALNHNAGEGSWEDRKAAASRAYREWLPFREREPAPAPLALWRTLRYGDLVDLFVLDARVWGRDAPLEMADPDVAAEWRHILGADQEAWLLDALSSSTAQWKLVAQQIIFAQFPQIWNQFAWDGYPAARRRILDRLRAERIEGVAILSGDFHSSWANDVVEDPWDTRIYDPMTGAGALAVELATPGVTSPLFPPDDARRGEADILAANPHTKWVELSSRGYVVVDAKPDRLQGAWFHFDRVDQPTATEHFARAYATLAGDGPLRREDAPAAPKTTAPPPAPDPEPLSR